MPGQQRLKSVLNRIGFPVSVWWSDVRFYWSMKDKTALVALAIFSFMTVSLGLFVSWYLKEQDRQQQLFCLALNVYHEARGEPRAGQLAVAEVTMNRVASKHYPDSVCKVVFQKNWDVRRKRFVGMFSWTELDYKPNLNSKLWQQSWNIAQRVVDKDYKPIVQGALFYHASYIKPRWARKKRPKAKIGRHIFY